MSLLASMHSFVSLFLCLFLCSMENQDRKCDLVLSLQQLDKSKAIAHILQEVTTYPPHTAHTHKYTRHSHTNTFMFVYMYAYTQTQCLKHKIENKTWNDDQAVYSSQHLRQKRPPRPLANIKEEHGHISFYDPPFNLFSVLNVALCGPLQQEVQKTAFQALQLQKDSVHGYIRQQVRRTADTHSFLNYSTKHKHKLITISPCWIDLAPLKPTNISCRFS